MRQVVRLDWPISVAGYKIKEIDRSKVDWEASPPDYTVAAPACATTAEIELLERWGMRLCPSDGEADWETRRFVEPIDSRSPPGNVMAKCPDLFVEFANIKGSEEKLLAFVDRYGLPWSDRPVDTQACFFHAGLMKTALEDWEKVWFNSSRALAGEI
jgi:hypothetical protein